jgi:Transglutaminase-like superfamily
MRRLRKFVALPAAERALMVRALATVVVVRVGLSLLPFGRLRAAVDRHSLTQRRAARGGDPGRIGWAVRAVSGIVPGASCLTQALAAQLLLAQAGQPSELHLGVKRSPEQGLAAHAWVTSGEVVVVGGEQRGGFTPLLRAGRSS